MEHCAGVGKESNPGSSLHPPVSSALVCRARWGCATGGTLHSADMVTQKLSWLSVWLLGVFHCSAFLPRHQNITVWCCADGACTAMICSSPAGALRHSAAVFCTHTHTAHGLHALGKINSPITSDCSCSVCDKTAELLSQCVHLPPLCFPGMTVMYLFVSVLASEQ